MARPTANDGTARKQTTGGKRTRILRTGSRPRPGAAAARVAALYEQHAALVLSICRRLLRDPIEAEDAAQQTFLSAQRALQNGSRPREPAAWLATIARNECVARTRARMREPLPTDTEPPASGPDAHTEAVRREKVETLRDAIGSLPEQQREAILLREVRGLSYDEVAASLALTPSAVESLLFRARKGLQLRLRGAWAAFSPVGWLATVRDLTTQAAAGGDSLAGPAAAKAVVLGLSTAVIAGGALVGPGALHPDRHHASRLAAAPTTTRAAPRRPAAPVAPVEVAAPSLVPATPVAQPEHPAEESAAASRLRISRTPAAAHAGDARPAQEHSSTEEPQASTVWSPQATRSEDTGSGGRGSGAGSAVPLRSEAAVHSETERESPEATSQSAQTTTGTSTGTTIAQTTTTTTPSADESEGSSSGGGDGGESGGGDRTSDG